MKQILSSLTQRFWSYRKYVIGTALILSGVAVMYFGFYGATIDNTPIPTGVATVQAQPQVVTTPTATTAPTTTKPAPKGTGAPVRIGIPDVAIDLPIAPGYYNTTTHQWSLSITSAHFATMASKPNAQSGNTFIYGHNRPSVFNRLTRIKTGSMAYVITDNGQRYSYRLRSVYNTVPEDASPLATSAQPILTLQTCTGAAFQNRTIYVFDLVGVNNA